MDLNWKKFEEWQYSPWNSDLCTPFPFCSFECSSYFIKSQRAYLYTFIRRQVETIIPIVKYKEDPFDSTVTQECDLFILRYSLAPRQQQVFDEVATNSLYNTAYWNTRDGQFQMAKTYETAYRLEDAAKIYENLGMWEDAGRVRKKDKQFTNITLDLNNLIDQLKKGNLATTYKCGNCGGNIGIDGETDVKGLKFCNYCGAAIQIHDIVEVIQRVLY
jgi:DNA-directed RNA polymerase subunit RPC12/RpoP